MVKSPSQDWDRLCSPSFSGLGDIIKAGKEKSVNICH